jgi:hypothetical protein
MATSISGGTGISARLVGGLGLTLIFRLRGRGVILLILLVHLVLQSEWLDAAQLTLTRHGVHWGSKQKD